MKALVKISLLGLLWIFSSLANAQQRTIKTTIKKPAPLVLNNQRVLNLYDYPWVATSLSYLYDWGLEPNSLAYKKYQSRYTFKIKNPLMTSIWYSKKSENTSYVFVLAKDKNIEKELSILQKRLDGQIGRDSIAFYSKCMDSVEKKNRFKDNSKNYYQCVGFENIRFVMFVFDDRKNVYTEEILEAEAANDFYPTGYFIKYPAWADSFVFNYKTEKWEYVESVYVENDHDQELYVYGKYAPWYLEEYKKRLK